MKILGQMQRFSFGITLILLQSGCNPQELARDLRGLSQTCEGVTPEGVRASIRTHQWSSGANDLFQKCKAGLKKKLPGYRTDLVNEILPFHYKVDPNTGRPTLVLQGLLQGDVPLSVDGIRNAQIIAKLPTSSRSLTRVDFTAKSLREAGFKVRATMISDLSASYYDQRSDAVPMLQQAFIDSFPVEYQAEVLAISDTVEQKQAYTDQLSLLLRPFDSLVPQNLGGGRLSASPQALSNAIEQALDHLSQSAENEVPVLFVSINALSGDWNEAQKLRIQSLLNASPVRVVLVTTESSDVTPLQSLLNGKGNVFYAPDFETLTQQMAPFFSSVENSTVLELAPEFSDLKSLSIESDGITGVLTRP